MPQRLVIKAESVEQARQYCLDRGLDPTRMVEAGPNTVVAYATGSLRSIVDWYCEPADMPAAPGTLLLH